MEASINDYIVNLRYLRNSIDTLSKKKPEDKIYYCETKLTTMEDFSFSSIIKYTNRRMMYGEVNVLEDLSTKMIDLNKKLDEIFKQNKISEKIVKENLKTIESIKNLLLVNTKWYEWVELNQLKKNLKKSRSFKSMSV